VVIANIKMFALKDLVNFASTTASGNGKIVIFGPLRPLLTHVQNFYPQVEGFTKIGDKFGWVKCDWIWENRSNLHKN